MAEAPSLSVKALARLRDLKHVGELTDDDATAASATLIETVHGAQHAADHIRLMVLLSADNSVIDAKFRTLATGAQLALYDVLAERLIGQPLQAAESLTPAVIEASLRDSPDAPIMALGDTATQPFYIVRKVIERVHGASAAAAPTTPAPAVSGAAALPWIEIGLFEKVRRIEQVLDDHVRPALASDGGGMDLLDLNGDQLFVQYQGACGSCSSSVGGTLQFVQDSLNNHLGTTLKIEVSGYEEEAEGPSII